MGLSGSLVAIALADRRQRIFSVDEISTAAGRRVRLRQMADEGDTSAARVLKGTAAAYAPCPRP